MAFLEGLGGRRRIGLVVVLAAIALGAASLGLVVWSRGTNRQPPAPVEQVFELRIAGGEVGDDVRTLRVTQGDIVRLRWTADAPTDLHLHGYDIEKEVTPGEVTEFRFTANATGRFPVEVHGAGGGNASDDSHDEAPLVVLEVYPP